MSQTTNLEIHGYGGRPVPNTFFEQETDTNHLAVIFPGLHYSAHMPVLYYPRLLLAQRGVDVLMLDTDYGYLDPQRLADDQSLELVYQEAEAAVQAGMARRNYARLTLLGKSLGTWPIGHLIAAGRALPKRVDCVWLTPMLTSPDWRELVMCGKRLNLIVTGTADRYYQAAALNAIERTTGCYKMVVEGADHALEIPGKAYESLRVLQRLIKTLDAFLWEDHRSKWAWI